MIIIKKILLGLGATLLTVPCFAQQGEVQKLYDSLEILKPINEVIIKPIYSVSNFDTSLNKSGFNEQLVLITSKQIYGESQIQDFNLISNPIVLQFADSNFGQNYLLPNKKQELPLNHFLVNNKQLDLNLNLHSQENEPFFKNRRNVYSSMWAFASLNYLYADLVGVMDKNKLVQYQTGVVEGVKITPEFLTVAAAFMQIPIANVFLPHLIKNEKTLRWVQIASGTIMTLVQSGTLFVGKPTPYYALFSAFEIAATTYITIDAIKWKAKSNKKKILVD